MELIKLRDFFAPDSIAWRIGVMSQDKTKGIALPYLTNRAVQTRLDNVCGPENWQNEYKPWKEKSQLCGISIRVDGEWITKWDGADDSKTEPTKGGLSDSMKRAAVQWGIGRYLYDLPTYWVDIVPSGKTYKIAQLPKLPKEFLPEGTGSNYQYAQEENNAVLSPDEEKFNHMFTSESQSIIIDKGLVDSVADWCIAYCMKPQSIAKLYDVKSIDQLTYANYMDLFGKMKARFPDFEAYEQNRQEKEYGEFQNISER